MRAVGQRELIGGFTFTELITAAVIIALIIAIVYSIFLGIAKFIGFFKHDVNAVVGARSWLDRKAAGGRYEDLNTTTGASITDLSTFQPLTEETDNVQAEYDISDVDAGSGAQYQFKRIDIKVQRDERDME